MNVPGQNKGANETTYMAAVRWFSYTVAFVVTLLGTGPFYNLTIWFIHDYVVHQYGYWISTPIQLVWMVVSGVLIFTFSVATVSTGIITAATVLLLRFAT
ncbi:hypothetical protein T8K17_25235 [Thalassobaculum sp. OXR-137]|uniref:hypothetical protein n=1 Tax=Thalassobaculum sp. OXR-137 TaxID=3100173 RepID=UPI002AC9C3D1|nr:hypothetical protein [Thalassobaculum sp. OXR-137]WPZ34515.1 hypothetical protein T8K17_25235 [Thalassobaculum sp. OXR-137]